MADVYTVKDIREGHLRALKLMPFQFLTSFTIVQRFRNEAREAKKLQHDNITRVLDYGEALADHYLVMELATGWTTAEGDTAIDVSELPKPVDEQTFLTITKQTCEALDVIHFSRQHFPDESYNLRYEAILHGARGHIQEVNRVIDESFQLSSITPPGAEPDN